MNRFAVKALAAAMLCAVLTPLGWAAWAGAMVVEDLLCRGNAATSCDFIPGHVYLARGEEVDEAELQNAQLRLSTLRTFESVSIYLEKGSQRGNAVVVVDVVEAEPIAAEWMLGASVSIQPENFFGTTKPFFTEHYESVLVNRWIGDRHVKPEDAICALQQAISSFKADIDDGCDDYWA